MKIKTMQRIDYCVGIPICFLLSMINVFKKVIYIIFRKFCYLNFKTKSSNKILFIELSEMGSAVLAYSAFMRAKKLYPDGDFYFLIFKQNKESVELLNFFKKENILTIDISSFRKFIITTFLVIFKLFILRLDAIVDLETFSRFTSIISFLAFPKDIVGFSNYTEEGLYRGNFLTKKVFYNPTKHIILNFLALVEALNKDKNFEVPLIKEDLSKYILEMPKYQFKSEVFDIMKKRLQTFNIKEDDEIVLINPDGGALPLRAWPVNYYIELINILAKRKEKYKFLIIGTKSSSFLAEYITSKTKNTYNFCGKTSNLVELLHLMEISKILITQDSGPCHFATLTNINMVALFGPETILRYAPMINKSSKQYISVISKDLHCAPCYSAGNHRQSVCKNNLCMQGITVKEVVDEIDKINSKEK